MTRSLVGWSAHVIFACDTFYMKSCTQTASNHFNLAVLSDNLAKPLTHRPKSSLLSWKQKEIQSKVGLGVCWSAENDYEFPFAADVEHFHYLWCVNLMIFVMTMASNTSDGVFPDQCWCLLAWISFLNIQWIFKIIG